MLFRSTLVPRNVYSLTPAPAPEKVLLYTFDSRSEALPALVEQPYGKGRMLYQTVTIGASLYAQEGTVGQDWRYNHDPALEALYKQILQRILGDTPWWRTDAPDRIHTTILRQPDALTIHFLNGAASYLKHGEIMPEFCPNPAWPPLQQDISFTIPCDAAKEVYAVSPDFQGRKPIPFFLANGKLTATLPKALLKAYTIVWIK